MGNKQGDSGIDYVDKSWGPWRGCTKVSEGCVNCYAEREMNRWKRDPSKVVRAADGTFYAPLKWKEPQRVFVCPWGDFYHPDVSFRDRMAAWAVIANTQRHTYLIVTKRPEEIGPDNKFMNYPNVQHFVTCENQARADERIPILLDLKARGIIQFAGVSLEPLLGDIRIRQYFSGYCPNPKYAFKNVPGITYMNITKGIDQVYVGCESGPERRDCPYDRIRSIVRQCSEASVPVFVKQIEVNGKVSHDPAEWPVDLRVRRIGS